MFDEGDYDSKKVEQDLLYSQYQSFRGNRRTSFSGKQRMTLSGAGGGGGGAIQPPTPTTQTQHQQQQQMISSSNNPQSPLLNLRRRSSAAIFPSFQSTTIPYNTTPTQSNLMRSETLGPPDAEVLLASSQPIEVVSSGSPSPRHRDSDASSRYSGRPDRWICASDPKLDGLDFVDPENRPLQDARIEDPTAVHPQQYKVWLVTGMIGVVVGASAVLMNTITNALTTWKFDTVMQVLEHHGRGAAWAFFIFVNMGLAVMSSLLIVFVAPIAGGSGIPEIKAYLNGIRVPHIVRVRTFIVKFVGIILSVASSLPVGKQGPMIHCGAILAAGISTGKTTRLQFDTGLFKQFRSDREKRNFVTSGTAAGVGAAFGAPLGGLLFAAEDLGSFWTSELTARVFFCGGMAAFTFQVLAFPSDIATHTRGLINIGNVEAAYYYAYIPFFCLLGAFGGLVGSAFVYLNMILSKRRKQVIRPYKYRRITEVAMLSLVTSVFMMLFSTVWYECGTITPDFQNNAVIPIRTYGCKEGTFNENMSFFFQQPEGAIRGLFSTTLTIQWSALAAHLVPYFLLTMAVYATAIPGGVFVPAIIIGATFGRLLSQFLNVFMPDDMQAAHNTFAILGAMALLTGILRDTVSLMVILMEAIGSTTLFVPMMLVSLCSKWVADYFTLGIYNMHIRLNRVPVLESELEDIGLEGLSAADVMNTHIVRIQEEMTCQSLIRTLLDHPTLNAFVVVDEEGVVQGLAPRRTLLILLKHKAFIDSEPLKLDAFVKSEWEKDLTKPSLLEAAKFTEEELGKTIDVSRYMEQQPFTVKEETSLARTHYIYRSLGLRHLIVVDDKQKPIGMITRKNLCHLIPVNDLTTISNLSNNVSFRHVMKDSTLHHILQT